MNKNLDKHKILKILYGDMSQNNRELKTHIDLGVSYKTLKNKLNYNDYRTLQIIQTLDFNEEIELNGNIYNITNKGIISHHNKKYLKEFWSSIFETSKNIVQILIPLLSLIVAILALSIKSNLDNKENKIQLEKIQNKIDQLESTILKSQNNSKTIYPYTSKLK